MINEWGMEPQGQMRNMYETLVGISKRNRPLGTARDAFELWRSTCPIPRKLPSTASGGVSVNQICLEQGVRRKYGSAAGLHAAMPRPRAKLSMKLR
jgi:hypothetical protein